LEQDWSRIFSLLLEHRKTTVFDGLGEEAVQSLVRMGELIECRRGQAIIKAGTVYKDIFIILEGKVEIRLGDMAIAVLGEGELFGEIAFLLGVERTTNVFALSDTVRVVSLREQDLAKLIHAESALASKLLHNISKLLCLRLVALHHLLER
jgi:CRP-like cAMP-binding protein